MSQVMIQCAGNEVILFSFSSPVMHRELLQSKPIGFNVHCPLLFWVLFMKEKMPRLDETCQKNPPDQYLQMFELFVPGFCRALTECCLSTVQSLLVHDGNRIGQPLFPKPPPHFYCFAMCIKYFRIAFS